MPSRIAKQNLVARPDRADFRDRMYQPPLRSLVDQYPAPEDIERHLKQYVDDENIRDQGKEGACTGFGLAAVVNYIYWARWMKNNRQGVKPVLVSPHMLYRNARVYDEWEGEDYEGSSCRGAMKGWYKHGVCKLPSWQETEKRPDDDWSHDAALRPLGAYYRVDAKSIADMQAAIFEVQAVYCSADVHAGWDKPQATLKVGGYELAVISPGAKIVGGHAFAVVGYTPEGFIVQNSWDTDWGTLGFALLTYEDWVNNGYDAWVAALGAPMRIGYDAGAPVAVGGANMMAAAAAAKAKSRRAAQPAAPMWSEEQAYKHSVVMGNDGKLLQRLLNAVDPADALKIVVEEKTRSDGHGRIAVYVHGGLNSEDGAIRRVRCMGPWFVANGIHPIFVVWRTGVMEAIGQIGQDEAKKFEEQVRSIRARGFGEAIVETAREAFDRAFEVAAEKFIGKAIWSQMKQNAAMAAAGENGIVRLVRALKGLGKPVHLLGHSAGAIMIGHMLDAARAENAKYASCGLYAPACTLDFATQHFGSAFTGDGPLSSGSLHLDILTDGAEVGDSVGPYGKSLLYLVSRALEDIHKMPLLGLDIALQADGKGTKMELNRDAHRKAFKEWQAVAAGKVTVEKHAGPKVKCGPQKTLSITHGTFDNDLKVVTASLTRMLNNGELQTEISDLTGF